MILQGKVWGYTVPVFNKNNVEIHYLEIENGGFCSKHLHKHKYNQFMVIDGQLKITIWKDYGIKILEDVTFIKSGQSCIVPPGDNHKFEAMEDTKALEIYWVELRDDDIIRKDHGGSVYAAQTSTKSENIKPFIEKSHRYPGFRCEDRNCSQCYLGELVIPD